MSGCSVAVQFLLQPDFDEGLVGHIAGVGRHFERVQQVLRQSQGNRFGGGLQVRECDLLGLGPIQMLRGVVGFPVRTLGGFVRELWDESACS